MFVLNVLPLSWMRDLMKRTRTHSLLLQQLLNGRLLLNQVNVPSSFLSRLYFCLFTMIVIDCFLIDSLRTEQSVTISKVIKRPVHASLVHETHKTNGHPVTPCTSKPCPSPRLGRPLYVRAQRSPRCVWDCW